VSERHRSVFRVPRYEGYVSGTGDLFSSILLGELLKNGHFRESVMDAVATALRSLQVVIQATLQCDAHRGFRELNIVSCIPELTGTHGEVAEKSAFLLSRPEEEACLCT
jgi:pyridoxal/pyridoxine/pyridoxamine kinase